MPSILRPRRARRRIPIAIAIPSGLLLLLSVIRSLLLLLLLLSIIRSLLLLLDHLLLIRQHLRFGLLVLPCADGILDHHATAVAGFHGGFLALAGADGAYEAEGLVFLLFLFAGVGDCVEERCAGCAGDVHLFAGGEVGGLWVGEEAAGWVEVDAGAAGERAAWGCGLGLVGGGGWLVEVHASAAGERAAWRQGLVVEMCAGAAGVWSTRRCGLVVEVHAGATRVRPARRSALVLYHVRPVARRSAGASERWRSLGHGSPELLDVETARGAGALVVCDCRSLGRIVWLRCHGCSLQHPLLWCQTLTLLVAGRAATRSPCNARVPAVASRIVAVGDSSKVGLPVVFNRADATRSHAS